MRTALSPPTLTMSWAVDNNSAAQVKSLLEYGADPNGVLGNKDSYLTHASVKNNAEILDISTDEGDLEDIFLQVTNK